MKMLQINQGVVVNIALLPKEAKIPTGWELCSNEDICIGWRKDSNGEFKPNIQEETPLTEEQQKAQQKIEGTDFEGTMCSATSEDMWGLTAIKNWIKAGESTTFEFSNGNKLTLDSNNIDAFEATWIPFRASFFQ